MDKNNINKQCLEKILQRLTNLICMLEYDEMQNILNLVDMAASISAQLLAVDEFDQTETEEVEETIEAY